MKELFDKTMERTKIIQKYFTEKLKGKGDVVFNTTWECDFDYYIWPEVDPNLKPINKRDAFYGGRTETIQLYNNTPNLKAKYVDFCSLYPTVNKYCEYPVGHPIKITNIPIDKAKDYFGIMKCKILPPRGLYHPVLPYKQQINDISHKLLFGLCGSCMNQLNFKCTHFSTAGLSKYNRLHMLKHCEECKKIKTASCNHTDEERVLVGTWPTIEINKALEKGYKIIKIYEVEHFEQTSTELFKPYVNLFMKYKLEASGCECNPKYCTSECKNDSNCKTELKYVEDNEEYVMDINNIEKNPGIRAISKNNLNCFWGHFGMRDNFNKKEHCFNIDQISSIVFDPQNQDINLMILDEDIVAVDYHTKEEYRKPNRDVNIYIALFTTAHARLKLYELLDILQERVLYLDSDSVIYHDDGSEACKKIKSKMGNNLGDLTDEIKTKYNANYITEFVSIGPKDYSMKFDNGKTENKCKGFRLNAEVEEKNTMDKKIKLVTDKEESYEIIKYNQIVTERKD